MADLIALSDLTARLGTLTAAQEARSAALIADASALARAEAPWLESTDDDSVVLRLNGDKLTLPAGPVTEVTTVHLITVSGDLLMPSGTYVFDGIDTIVIDLAAARWIINLPETWNDVEAPGTFRVVYSHGFTEVPADVKAVVCNMVSRVLTAPSMAEGLTGENIGQYGYQMSQAMGASGAGVRVTDADRRILRQTRYRRGRYTIETPVGA